MLIILGDPAGITGRRRIPWGAGSVFEQIVRAMPDGGGDCEVRYNGAVIDPVRDPRMTTAPAPDDEVIVVRRPAGLDPITWVAIASAVFAAYSYTLIPKPADQPQVSQSPNNQLTGQTNIARAYQAIPDVYGQRRVWPDLIQQSAVHYDAAGVKMVTEVMCVSRGKGLVSSVSYADTLLQDIAGAGSQIFEPSDTPNTYPEDNTTTVTDLLEVYKSPEVNGQELSAEEFPSVISRSATVVFSTFSDFTIECDDGADLAEMKALSPSGSALVEFSYPVEVEAGYNYEWFSDECDVLGYSVSGGRVTFSLHAQNALFFLGSHETTVSMFAGVPATTVGPFTLPSAGNRIRANIKFPRGLKGRVDITAEFWQIDGGGVEIPGTRDTDDSATRDGGPFEADTYDERCYTWDITPSAGAGVYRVQFSRVTDDLGNGADVVKLDELYAMTYSATRTFPGVTLARVVTRATPQATGIRERKFNLVWTRKVRSLSSAALSASRNFARAFVHLWAISGNAVSEIDTAALQAINTALGEDGQLSRFDWSFDDANLSLGERLQAIANAARCVVWRDGAQWTLTRDQARTTPELQLDYRNLAAGGESSISYSAHLPASEDGVELEFVEEVSQARKDYVRINVSSGAPVIGVSANPKKIKLIGCATQAQALNRALLEARKLIYQRTSVQDTALADAASLGPGSLVRWIDPHDFYIDDGLQAGEVIAVAGSDITTSEPLQWGAESTGRMILTGADGLALGPPVVVTPISVNTALLASVPSGLYVRDDQRQLGSRYAFGAGLSATEIEAAGLYTVTEIRPASDRSVVVSMVNYDARLYLDDNVGTVAQASEVDTAATVRSSVAEIGRAAETDAALTISRNDARALGIAQETDAAQTVAPA